MILGGLVGLGVMRVGVRGFKGFRGFMVGVRCNLVVIAWVVWGMVFYIEGNYLLYGYF